MVTWAELIAGKNLKFGSQINIQHATCIVLNVST